MKTKIVDRPWFALVEFVLALSCGVTWFLYPQASWFPLILALLPWGIRLVAGRPILAGRGLDLASLAILLSAAVGVWAAYDRGTAMSKFWVILGAILIFYALARQPRENLLAVSGLFSLLALALALSYLFGQDWQAEPTGIGSIDRLGQQWMAVRPFQLPRSFHPNQVGGLIAISLPLSAALVLESWQARKERNVSGLRYSLALISFGFLFLVCSIALFMTSSRGAWIALVLAAMIWGLWTLSDQISRFVARVLGKLIPRKLIFLLCLALVGSAILWITLRFPGGPIALADSLPGESSGDSRLALAQETFDLILDFPFTGGGLGSFPGLFSHYIMGMPVFLFGYSHNLYLDVALELGILGFLAFFLVLVITGWNLGKQVDAKVGSGFETFLLGAIVVGFLTFLVHGLVDDAVFGMRGTPILFSWTGLALALGHPRVFELRRSPRDSLSRVFSRDNRRRAIFIFGGSLLAALVLAVVFVLKYEPLVGSWYANLGAVRVSQEELADFPSGKWDDGDDLEILEESKGYFIRALSLDPWNHTSHYRLGLIAWSEGDYSAAVTHLEFAYLQRPTHRGIRKTLGFSYVWVGDYAKAKMLLGDLPEAIRELHIYQGWWKERGREDLANQAVSMMAFIEKPGN